MCWPDGAGRSTGPFSSVLGRMNLPKQTLSQKEEQDDLVFMLPCSPEASLTRKIQRFHSLQTDSALWRKGVGCHQDLESITVPFSGPFEFQKMRCRERVGGL